MSLQEIIVPSSQSARDTVFGHFAHDVRVLLTIVQQCARTAGTPHFSYDRQACMLQAVEDGLSRAIAMSGEMLDYVRDDRESVVRFDLVERTRALGRLLGHMVGSRVGLHLQLPGHACFVQASPLAFDAALVNLISNARNAIVGSGSIIVRVEDHGSDIEIQVEDNGCGVRPLDAQRVFEPFYTREAGRRSGLGLGQVARFIHAAGGELGVRTCAGRGTAISLYIPAADEALHWEAEELPLVIEHRSGEPGGQQEALLS